MKCTEWWSKMALLIRTIRFRAQLTPYTAFHAPHSHVTLVRTSPQRVALLGDITRLGDEPLLHFRARRHDTHWELMTRRRMREIETVVRTMLLYGGVRVGHPASPSQRRMNPRTRFGAW